MSEDLTGRRVGHYRIDGVLGRGGMSVMYKATDVRLGRKVALKVIGEHLGEDLEFRERFVDEARNTSAIDHPNVVPLYDFGEADGLLYIAMRLVDGSDLASLMSAGPIAPDRALALLGQVAEALDTLHGGGLVHLDLKPANVLVTSREATNEHVYLADFGLTRRGATGHRTRTGDFLGSPTYAAPEHLRGEPVDGRADAYSLACMLFACLAGRVPYQGDVQDVIGGHLNAEPPLASAVVQLPAAIDEVVRRGMAKDPDGRYPDCRELIKAARAALAGVPDRSVPPPPVGQYSGADPGSGVAGAGTSGAASGEPEVPTLAGPQHGGGHPAGAVGAGPAAPASGQGQGGAAYAPAPYGAPGLGGHRRPGQGQPGQGQPGQGYSGPQSPGRPGGPAGASHTPPGGYPQSQPGGHGAPYGGGPGQYPQAGPPAAAHQVAPSGNAGAYPPQRPGAGRARSGRPVWLVPVLVGAAAITLIIVLIVVSLNSTGSGGRKSDSGIEGVSTQHTTAPEIPVGPT